MIYLKSILFLLIALVSSFQSFGQDIPKVNNTKITAFVDYPNKDNGLYIYNYSIQNGESSSGNIMRLEIDISIHPTDVVYDSTSLEFANEYTQYRFKKDFPKFEGSVVPVGIPALPQFWRGVITSEKKLVLRTDVRNDIEPGEKMSGFKLSSKGLPGLKKFKAEPFIDVRKFYPSEFEVSNVDSLINVINKDRNQASDTGYTVGPTAPPKNFVTEDFVDTLSSFLDQSCTEPGWITTQGICRSLEAKLENVERQLDQGNTNAASSSLQAFINEVDAQKNKQLSSEAYALLYFNGLYLLERLNE